MSDPASPSARQIVRQVIELTGPEMESSIRRLCGDDQRLLQEVRALLAASGATRADPIGGSASSFASDDLGQTAMIAERPGAHIGPYVLVQLIGEGGFGSVFMAEQERPVQRTVALKIIKLGMDTRAVVARFEQERQALALMDHPNIAKVFDAGATASGRPYFVMEYCRGEPITTYCDTHNLSIPARFSLFIQVCEAVQHAHQKGLIHRDIKPSNVLVSYADDHARVKVIDFGIAKATASKLTEETLFTAQAQMLGTPQYMSPEQAEGSADIDTRTDVYSLGVLLYELLTGTTPFDGRSLRQAAYAEIQRIIREVDPPRPSTRLSEQAGTVASVAAQRQIEPRQLQSTLRGELDWIVMKALDKDRTHRYDTPGSLALDIRRYLAGEAIVAAPPSKVYRARKFIRRNRVLATSAGAVALALLAGAAGFAWQAHRAGVQRDAAVLARRAEGEQREIAEKQRASAEEQRNRAVTAETDAKSRAAELQKVVDFQAKMLGQVDPTSAGINLTEDVRSQFDAALTKSGFSDEQKTLQTEAFAGLWGRINATDTARKFIDRTLLKPALAAIDTQFADQPLVAATLRHAIAERYDDLGFDDVAAGIEEGVLATRRRLLGDDHPDTLEAISNSGVFLAAVGKSTEAEALHREALDRSRRVLGDLDPSTLLRIANLGALLLDNGRLSDAEVLYREALEKRRRTLGPDHPDTLESLGQWGMLLRAQGKFPEAEAACREALAGRQRVLGKEDSKTVHTMNNLGTLLKDEGKVDDALVVFREVVNLRRRSLGDAHPKTLTAIQNLGATLDVAGHSDEAELLLREALASQRRLFGADSSETLTSLGNLTVFLIGQRKLAEAEPLCRETLERRRRVLGENHPATLIAMNVMGLVLVQQGKFAEAEPYWRQVLEISRRTLGPTHPETLTYTHNLGGLMVDENKLADAEKLYRQVIQDGTAGVGPAYPTVLSATRRLGTLMFDQKRYPEAIELLSAAEPNARKTYTGSSARTLATFLTLLGRAEFRADQCPAAEPRLLEAQAIILKTRGPAHAETRNAVHLLAEFYATWDKSDPGKGHDAKAAEWKTRLDELIASTRPAASQPK